jgi:cell division transport system permease protein
VARLRAYVLRHAQTVVGTLGRLARAPVETATTILVIGVALALPLALHVLVHNVGAVTSTWNYRAEISLFLDPGLPAEATAELRERLTADPAIGEVTVIPAAAGLETLRAQSGLGEVLDALGENPLPDVLVIVPSAGADDAGSLGALATRLAALPEVDRVREDYEWVRRLQAAVDLAGRLTLVAALLLTGAMLLVVGNAIRLEIAGRREEIVVTKLIGATDGFVRRPFVYMGLWYGAAGGLTALALVALLLLALASPVDRLATLYDTHFALSGLSLRDAAAVLAGGAVLGALSAWLAAVHHLRRVEPN